MNYPSHRCLPPGAVPYGQTRALLRLVERQERGAMVAVRDLSDSDNVSGAHRLLLMLRERGLVSWEDGKKYTLRARVRPVPLNQRKASR